MTDPVPTDPLPIHFFTIVLNGEPFIRYHHAVFQRLPFRWHWHIIEGVAELVRDTAWPLATGGTIPSEFHDRGRSNDGTSAYLDELAQQSDQITVYRKPLGEFWQGKVAMVQAPLAHITEPCVLWQVDVDELWTVQQIVTTRRMFLAEPTKTAAFYWCWYFVGPERVISTRYGYAEDPNIEWLRTWRFTPGMRWFSHVPPRLGVALEGEWQDVAGINPFSHAETEAQGLVFQHFAYVTVAQVLFKERYYGYPGAGAGWQRLQTAALPLYLGDYFPWVRDATQVHPFPGLPLAQQDQISGRWTFLSPGISLMDQDHNFILRPDWSQPEETIFEALENLLLTLAPRRLWIDCAALPSEQAELLPILLATVNPNVEVIPLGLTSIFLLNLLNP